ncbi:MAG: ATP-binding protein [Pseudomonadota bacterium]
MIDQSKLLETLNEWNYWNRELPDTVAREGYESEVLRKATTGEIVILKGVRRSGKSTILINTIKRLIADGIDRKNILFINLEDPRFINNLNVDLLSQLRDTYLEYLNPSGAPYIFLDEIQNISGFEKWALKEYELRTSRLMLTGSNAKLLSREIGSALSGRYLDVLVFPLSFAEYLAFKGIHIKNRLDFTQHRIQINRALEEYLTFGGFPRVALTDEPELKKAELKAYFDSILLRDVVTRYRLENVDALMGLSVFLLSNISNLLSLNALKNHFKLSFDLINRYVEYLENAYLIFRVPLFDWSLKRQQVNPKKVYAIDTGLSHIVSFRVGQKTGDRLENLVFLELLRQGKEIYYYKTTGNLEVDFVVKHDEQITQLIQVSAAIDDQKTKAREIKALIKASNELSHGQAAELILLVPDVNETVEHDGKEVHIRDVKGWLLGIH